MTMTLNSGNGFTVIPCVNFEPIFSNKFFKLFPFIHSLSSQQQASSFSLLSDIVFLKHFSQKQVMLFSKGFDKSKIHPVSEADNERTHRTTDDSRKSHKDDHRPSSNKDFDKSKSHPASEAGNGRTHRTTNDGRKSHLHKP